MISMIRERLDVGQVQAFRLMCVILCLIACCGCDRQSEETQDIPKGHFRLTIEKQADQEGLRKLAGSRGVVVNDIIEKPIVIRFVIDTPSEGTLKLDRVGKWDGWQGWAGGGSMRLSFPNIPKQGTDRNNIRATVTLAALIDYHYRDPKPYPVLLVRQASATGGSAGGICYTRREWTDFDIKGQMLDASLRGGNYKFGSTLEIAKFMGESITLEVSQ
ncbi:MAG: hypothetical protein ACYSR6_03530 [Planctomycetota bacterium]|jgi:hypothetical protein